jgi:hypothetical protein
MFLAALRDALRDARPGEIEIEAEVALSSRPLDVDFVVIKKNEGAKLAHPIARIFRRYNLIEYKSPADYLDANDFDKGLALAFLYKALRHPQLATLDEFTFTYISSGHPQAMLKMLGTRKLTVTDAGLTPGIYAVTGWIFPVQVVVLNELVDPETAYMFTAFVTRGERHRVSAASLMIKRHLEDPANENLGNLVGFMFKNERLSPGEIKEVFEMTHGMTPEERKQMHELYASHPFTREWAEELRTEGQAKGWTEGQAELICGLLETKFGSESFDLQKMVRELPHSDVLITIAVRLFSADSREEAQDIIREVSGRPSR